MEPKQFQKLRQKMNTLLTESDQFINWLVTKAVHHPFVKCDRDIVYLRYTGKDMTFIFRLFKAFISKHFPNFILDAKNSSIIEYLISITTGKAPKRGLILHGTVGTGKTLLLILWIEFRTIFLENSKPDLGMLNGLRSTEYCFYTSGDLIREFNKEGHEFFNYKHGDILILDDIGEQAEINNFGTKINLLSEMITSRYSQFKQDSTLELYATTNLISNQLKNVIGERAFSRLYEMCEWNEGLLNGQDRRFSDNPVKRWPPINWHKRRMLAC
jgi:DNA replication protein DnaC